jgi:hypothetical protein
MSDQLLAVPPRPVGGHLGRTAGGARRFERHEVVPLAHLEVRQRASFRKRAKCSDEACAANASSSTYCRTADRWPVADRFPVGRLPAGTVAPLGIVDIGGHAVGTASPDDQRAKLQRVEMVARYFWGNEL